VTNKRKKTKARPVAQILIAHPHKHSPENQQPKRQNSDENAADPNARTPENA